MGKNKEKLNIFLLHFLERLNSNEPNKRKVIESLTDFCNYYDFTKGFIYQTDGFRYFLLKETIGNEGGTMKPRFDMGELKKEHVDAMKARDKPFYGNRNADASWDDIDIRKYSINSLVYWVTYVHNVVYSFYRSMIYCYINSTQRCAGSIVIDIIPTNGADKRKFFPFAPYFPVTNVIKRYFYPYFPAIIGIKGYSFPYFPYLSGIMKIKTALYSLFSRLDWHKTVVFPCLGEIYEGIRSLSWEIPVT